MSGPGAEQTRRGEAAVEAVRSVVLGIPSGTVLSYGDVAELAQLGSPRLAARIMSLGQAGEDVPWWRVVRADGTLPDRLQIAAREAYERLTGRAFDPRGGFFEVTGPADA